VHSSPSRSTPYPPNNSCLRSALTASTLEYRLRRNGPIEFELESDIPVKTYAVGPKALERFEKGSKTFRYRGGFPDPRKSQQQKVWIPFAGPWYLIISNPSRSESAAIDYEVRFRRTTKRAAPVRQKRRISAAARKAMADAARRRWASVKASKQAPGTSDAASTKSAPQAKSAKKRRISAAGRRVIAEAARRRWAAVRANKSAPARHRIRRRCEEERTPSKNRREEAQDHRPANRKGRWEAIKVARDLSAVANHGLAWDHNRMERL